MSDEPEPIFPLELEQEIFLRSLHDDKGHALNLILVAQRVYQWVIPEIFKVIVLRDRTLPSKYSSIRPSKADLMRHGKHIHHIVLSDTASADAKYDCTPAWCLSQCPNLTDLALWDRSRQHSLELIDQFFSCRHLTHLSFSLRSLNEGLKAENREVPHPLTTVTHLELLSDMDYYTNVNRIREIFPSVTHLGFIGAGAAKPNSKILEDVLALYGNRLEVLIWSPGLGKEVCPEVLSTLKYTHIEDPRIVILYHGNNWAGAWFSGVQGDSGIWKVAEETVRARRSSE